LKRFLKISPVQTHVKVISTNVPPLPLNDFKKLDFYTMSGNLHVNMDFPSSVVLEKNFLILTHVKMVFPFVAPPDLVCTILNSLY
jgi:hypothetical protein